MYRQYRIVGHRITECNPLVEVVIPAVNTNIAGRRGKHDIGRMAYRRADRRSSGTAANSIRNREGVIGGARCYLMNTLIGARGVEGSRIGIWWRSPASCYQYIILVYQCQVHTFIHHYCWC